MPSPNRKGRLDVLALGQDDRELLLRASQGAGKSLSTWARSRLIEVARRETGGELRCEDPGLCFLAGQAWSGKEVSSEDADRLRAWAPELSFVDGREGLRLMGRSKPVLGPDDSIFLQVWKNAEGTFYWGVIVEGEASEEGVAMTLSEASHLGTEALAREYYAREPAYRLVTPQAWV